MISEKEAEKKARKLQVPEPGTGEFVVCSSIEVLHFFMKLNNLEVAKPHAWRGNFLQVRPARPAIVEETEEIQNQEAEVSSL